MVGQAGTIGVQVTPPSIQPPSHPVNTPNVFSIPISSVHSVPSRRIAFLVSIIPAANSGVRPSTTFSRRAVGNMRSSGNAMGRIASGNMVVHSVLTDAMSAVSEARTRALASAWVLGSALRVSMSTLRGAGGGGGGWRAAVGGRRLGRTGRVSRRAAAGSTQASKLRVECSSKSARLTQTRQR
jgi:hypothetical protein